ncbi:MAG: DUF5908 family protein [Saprospiraceae bacterium]|jgi:hypothetical protein|nr:DUF5908 family protein [Saprospiraceae bacterium]
MPVEIRELVIQAQVAKQEDASIENSAEKVEKKERNLSPSSPSDNKDELLNELKIWVVEYLEKQQRKF